MLRRMMATTRMMRIGMAIASMALSVLTTSNFISNTFVECATEDSTYCIQHQDDGDVILNLDNETTIVLFDHAFIG